MAGRGRPPRLEPRATPPTPPEPPTPERLLERAKVAGPGAAPGRTELRSIVERLAAGDRRTLAGLAPTPGFSLIDAWAAVRTVFGATPETPTVDAALALDACDRAAARVDAVAATGGTVAFACSVPASLLGVHAALATRARTGGAAVPSPDDTGAIRADGRAGRRLRWFDGIAVVSDGRSLLATDDPEVARDWLFVIGRPTLVVADGPFATVAWEDGIEVVSLTGPDRPALAPAAARGERCTVVPMRTDRPPSAYRPLVERLGAPPTADVRQEETPGSTLPPG